MEELKEYVKNANKEYKRIENLLNMSGFTLSTRFIFYGDHPFKTYCGEIENYQSCIDNEDKIKESHMKDVKECLQNDTVIFGKHGNFIKLSKNNKD